MFDNEIEITPGLITVCVLAIAIVVFISCSDIVHIKQNQSGFAYNSTDSREINSINNPSLPIGWHISFGWNAKHLVVDSEQNRYQFTASEKDGFSPFNEAMYWDSSEGTTMLVNYTITGGVTDMWKFYQFFGNNRVSYSKIGDIKDVRIYAALRLAGRYAAVKMVEMAAKGNADYIMRHPKEYSDKLTALTKEYAEKFGFTVSEIIFPASPQFPDGSAIKDARAKIQTANTDLEKRKITAKTAAENKKNLISQGKMEASRIIGEGQRKADALSAEADALAKQLKASIEQVGVDGAVSLKMAELQGELTGAGVISNITLTGDSVLGKVFYGTK